MLRKKTLQIPSGRGLAINCLKVLQPGTFAVPHGTSHKLALCWAKKKSFLFSTRIEISTLRPRTYDGWKVRVLKESCTLRQLYLLKTWVGYVGIVFHTCVTYVFKKPVISNELQPCLYTSELVLKHHVLLSWLFCSLHDSNVGHDAP